MKTIRFVSDPGHGWALVLTSELRALGIVDKISRYSYLNGQTAALEEDCDLGVYCEALRAAGIRHSVGAYKLEEEGVRLFSRIEGDYFTILGLPLIELLTWLGIRGDIAT